MAVTLGSLRRLATEELEQILQAEGSGFSGLKWAVISLQAPGKLLSPNKQAFAWGLLPLLVIEAAGGDPRIGLPLAASAEYLIAAADVFDDIEDGDSPTGLERLCGIPTAINVGLFLMCISQLAVHRLTIQGIDPRLVNGVGRALAAGAARACGGQQQDIDQDDALLTEDGYLAMVQAKSGGLVEGVCRAAATLGEAPPTAIDDYANFGLHLGMALQVSNDIKAVASTETAHRNDVAVGKRTLATTSGVLYASVVADVLFENAYSSLDEAGCPAKSQLRTYLTAMRGD